MYVCLAQDSFVRIFEDNGYITNQLTRQDKLYDLNGKIFLQQITRKPKLLSLIVESLSKIYSFVSHDELERDFSDFVFNLEKENYVVTGNDEREIEKKMPRFSYKIHDIKTKPQTEFDFSYGARGTTDFFQKYFRDNPHIFSTQFELTNSCNEKCRHCYLPKNRKFDNLETPLVLSLLDQFAEMGTLNLALSGGECLLHPDFIPILKHAREKDFIISVLSNITLLNDDIIQALKEANINFLQASVYSMNPEEHDYITQIEGSHAKTIRSLERLIEAGVPVQVSCPTMRSTYKSYRQVLEWAYSHGIKGYTDYIMMARIDNSTDNLTNRLTMEETGELLRDIVNYDIEYRSILDANPTPELLNPDEPVCGAGVDSMCVAANGEFYPCSGFSGLSSRECS